jgi:hypothetical protein
MAKKNSVKTAHWYTAQLRYIWYLVARLWSLRLIKLFVFFLAFFIIAPTILFVWWRPHTPEKIDYGITFSHRYAQELGQNWQDTYLKILDDLGVDQLRLVVYWDETEPQQDQYDFGVIKWQLNEAQKRGIPVILITGRKVVRWPECFEPPWWEAIEDEATRNEELYEFVRQSVLELETYENIVMWQVENEPFWPFGDCAGEIQWDVLREEVEIVRNLDDRPIVIQDSGEGGWWLPSYRAGDYLAISMYRRIWYDFWGLIFGRPVYFQYPLASWSYKIKAELVGVPPEKIIVTELQAEPWGPGSNAILSREEKNKTMSRTQFIDTLNYAQKTGFTDLYLWGAEWWLLEKEVHNEPFYWDTAKALFN